MNKSPTNIDGATYGRSTMVEMPMLGSRVKIEVDGPAGLTSHEGVVLPGAASDHITLKLVNGYNVSPVSYTHLTLPTKA